MPLDNTAVASTPFLGLAGLTAAALIADTDAARTSDNPWVRQVAVMIGIAASVALGVAVVLWSQAPNFAPLYGNLAEKDASQVMDALQAAGVEYRVDEASGMVIGLGKQAFYAQIDQADAAAWNYAKHTITLNNMAEDAQNGIKAFLNKKKPEWKNR